MRRFEWDVELCPDPAPGPEQLFLEKEEARERTENKNARGEAARRDMVRAIHRAAWAGRPCTGCAWRCPATGWCVLPRCLALGDGGAREQGAGGACEAEKRPPRGKGGGE